MAHLHNDYNIIYIFSKADDEQSDFFHESGPSCGIPGVIPWWENERVDSGDESICTDKQFQKILNGSFQHLSRSSQIAFKARMTKIMKHVSENLLLCPHSYTPAKRLLTGYIGISLSVNLSLYKILVLMCLKLFLQLCFTGSSGFFVGVSLVQTLQNQGLKFPYIDSQNVSQNKKMQAKFLSTCKKMRV